MSEFIETPRDLAEILADMLGIQGDEIRIAWIDLMAERIAKAVISEFDLDRAAQMPMPNFWTEKE